MSDAAHIHTALHHYVEMDDSYYSAYEAYEPDTDSLMHLSLALPSAHMVIASRYSCTDCARNMPKMARIAEHLPGWTWDVYHHDENRERSDSLGISRIPTFILYDHEGGREIGRIVENPTVGSLESDLLQIITAGQ